jgi:hypothetical protein
MVCQVRRPKGSAAQQEYRRWPGHHLRSSLQTGRTGKFENVACEVNPKGTYFTKGLADERDHAVGNFYDSFPEFGPVPDNWKKRVMMQLLRQGRARRLRRTGGSASCDG